MLQAGFRWNSTFKLSADQRRLTLQSFAYWISVIAIQMSTSKNKLNHAVQRSNNSFLVKLFNLVHYRMNRKKGDIPCISQDAPFRRALSTTFHDKKIVKYFVPSLNSFFQQELSSSRNWKCWKIATKKTYWPTDSLLNRKRALEANKKAIFNLNKFR